MLAEQEQHKARQVLVEAKKAGWELPERKKRPNVIRSQLQRAAASSAFQAIVPQSVVEAFENAKSATET